MSRHHTEALAAVLAAATALWCGAAAAQAQATSNVRPAGTPNPPAAQSTVAPAAPPAPSSSSPAPGATSTPTPQATAPTASAGDNDTSRQAAKAALEAPSTSQFRPSGPITVTADRADLVQGGYAIYNGHVVLSSNTLKMQGNRMELRQQGVGQFTATLSGRPATLSHPSTGPEDPPVTAHAKTVVFDSATQLITLSGDAQLTRGHNIVEGQTIRYSASDHRVQATGGDGGRVHMVIQPPPPPAPPAAPTDKQP